MCDVCVEIARAESQHHMKLIPTNDNEEYAIKTQMFTWQITKQIHAALMSSGTLIHLQVARV